MAFPPPPSDLETALLMGYPAQTPPSKHGARQNNSKPRSSAQAQPVCKCSKSPWLYQARVNFFLVCALISHFAVTMTILFFLYLFLGPPYPVVQVSGLNVSGLAVAATTNATWKASLVIQQDLMFFGNSSFQALELFLYYNWDAGQPLALASVDPIVLRVGGRAEISGNMTMKSTDEGLVGEMHRQRRSLGRVAVGVGLRMEGDFVFGSWWRKRYGRIQAYCDNVNLVFNNPGEGEGSLVTRHNLHRCSFSSTNCYARRTNIHEPTTLIRCPLT